MKIGSLFAGIGGLELGLGRAGVGHTVWQVEKDPYCRQVLARHWPEAVRYEDVETVDWSTVERVEVLCGGFPCPDISLAGKGAGIDGDRSGLWRHYADAVRALRPRWVVVENVAAIVGRGLDRVVGDLAACGYDAEWDCLPACTVGSPQERDRWFLLAYPEGVGQWPRLREGGESGFGWGRLADRCGSDHRWPAGRDVRRGADGFPAGMDRSSGEPVLTAYGVPHRSERMHALGNAVVPQVAEVVGRRLLEIAGVA